MESSLKQYKVNWQLIFQPSIQIISSWFPAYQSAQFQIIRRQRDYLVYVFVAKDLFVQTNLGRKAKNTKSQDKNVVKGELINHPPSSQFYNFK